MFEDDASMAVEQPAKPRSGRHSVAPIDRMVPGSETHTRVLSYMKQRLKMSEDKMRNFHHRWTLNERRLQAYISLPDYEQMLKDQNELKGPSAPVNIVVPYTYSSMATIVTYLFHVFCSRKPIFQVGTYNSDFSKNAMNMETMLQYNADNTRLLRHLWQVLQDGETYGVGVLLTKFVSRKAMRTRIAKKPMLGIFSALLGGGSEQKVREEQLVYQGNEINSVDPYMFFPDPRVPMSEVNRKGEFVFWRSFAGTHDVRKREGDGEFKWTKHIPKGNTGRDTDGTNTVSDRSILSQGDPTPGANENARETGNTPFIQLDQGTIELIPADLDLGESTRSEKWIVTIANGAQIIQIEPFEADHDMHPVAVAEPSSVGYGFGQPSTTDLAGPMQDTISWFMNSHIENVRTAINNMFVADPSMIEMQDLREPGAGKIIRLKRTAFGMDVRAALQQLQVYDVTQKHPQDMQVILRMADALSGVNDNLRGLQNDGGRKTAAEVRTSNESSTSRLAAKARLISCQMIADLTEQMSLNIQQYLDMEFMIQVLGTDGAAAPIKIGPNSVVGDFYYPVHDGTLPLDKVATLEIWKELYLGISQNPLLAQRFDLPGMFNFMAELAGARNLDQFDLTRQGANGIPPVNMQPQPDQAVAAQAQAGNIVPIGKPGMRAMPQEIPIG